MLWNLVALTTSLKSYLSSSDEIGWELSGCISEKLSKSVENAVALQSEYRKMQTRKNSVFGHFSHSDSGHWLRILYSGWYLNFAAAPPLEPAIAEARSDENTFKFDSSNCKFEVMFIKQSHTLHKKWSLPLRISSVNVTKSAETCGFVTFSEEILNGKLYFLCSEKLSNSVETVVALLLFQDRNISWMLQGFEYLRRQLLHLLIEQRWRF